MGDFLSRLAERTLGLAEVARPRLAPLFAADGPRSPLDAPELAADDRDDGSPPSQTGDPPRISLAVAGIDVPAPSPPVPDAAETASRRQTRDRSAARPLVAPEPQDPRAAILGAQIDRLATPGDPEDRLVPPTARQPAPALMDHEPVAPTERRADDAPLVPNPPPAADGPFPGQPIRSAIPSTPLTGARREEPAVSVTIGRVEVRAVYPSPPPARPAPRPTPQLTLEEYVRQRREGLR